MKTFTFVKHLPSISDEEFAERWKQETLESYANAEDSEQPDRVAHCLVRQRRRPNPFDGIEISWSAAGVSPLSKRSVLIDQAASVSIQASERCAHGGPALEKWMSVVTGERRLVLLALIEAAENHTRETYRKYWWEEHRPLADELLPKRVTPPSYMHNYVDVGDPSNWAGIAEMYEESFDLIKERGGWTGTPEAKALMLDEKKFMIPDTRQSFITDQEIIIA